MNNFGNPNGGIMGGGIMGGGGALPLQPMQPQTQGGIMGGGNGLSLQQQIPQVQQPQQPFLQLPQAATTASAETMGLSAMNSGEAGIMDNPGLVVGAASVRVRSVALGATRPQAQQYRRGFDVIADGSSISSICNKILSSHGGNVTPIDMAEMMSRPSREGKGVVQLSGGTEGTVGIENDWGTERYRFVIVADIIRAGRHVSTEVVSGYTDYCAINNPLMPNSRSISPAMKFIVNNVARTNVNQQYGTAGANFGSKIQSSSSILRNVEWSGPTNAGQQYLTRPVDVAKTYAKLPLFEGIQQRTNGFSSPMPFAGQSIMDVDSTLAGTPKMAGTTSNLPTTFSSKLINGLVNEELPQTDPMNIDGASGASIAAAAMREHHFGSQNFINAIKLVARNNIGSSAEFTYQDLLRLDPTIDDRCQVYTQSRALQGTSLFVPDGSSVENLAASTPQGMGATLIAQGIAGLMLQGGISLITITATNYSGNTMVVPTGFDGMDTDGLLHQRVQQLCNRLKIEVFDVITMCDSGSSFLCEIIADGFNDIYVSLTMDMVKMDFVFPTYASASLSPLVTGNQNKSHALAKGVQNVIEAIKGSINTNANATRPSFGGGLAY